MVNAAHIRGEQEARVNNRLYRLLTGHSHFDWRLVVGGIASSAITYLALFILPDRTIFYGVWAALILVSFAGWAAAVRWTGGTLRRSSYQAVRLAALPPTEVIDGLLLAAVHRLRFLLGWLVGAAPLLAISAYRYTYGAALRQCVAFVSRQNWAEVALEFGFQRLYRLPESVRCVTASDPRLIAPVLATGPILLALAALLPLLLLLGVAWGLAHEGSAARPLAAGGLLAATVAALVAIVAARLLSPALRAPTVCQGTTCTYILPWPPGIPLETALLPILVLGFGGLRRLACRWVA